MNYKFYSKTEYLREIIASINRCQAGDQISITTMEFRPEFEQIRAAIEALEAAARRKVKVKLAVDAYSFRLGLPSSIGARRAYLGKLTAAGGEVGIVNRPTVLSNPYAGRMHCKLAVIDDRVFIGNSNLNHPDQTDMMVGWTDQSTADYLQRLVGNTIKLGSFKLALDSADQQIKIDAKTDLLIDAGVPGKSLILERALEAIDRAENIVKAAFYLFPTGQTAQSLKDAARRGVSVELFTNRISQHLFPHSAIQALVAPAGKLKLGKKIQITHTASNKLKLHAKLLVADNLTVFGSHNLAPSGVRWGTGEIALLSQDPKFGQAAIKCLEELIKTG